MNCLRILILSYQRAVQLFSVHHLRNVRLLHLHYYLLLLTNHPNQKRETFHFLRLHYCHLIHSIMACFSRHQRARPVIFLIIHHHIRFFMDRLIHSLYHRSIIIIRKHHLRIAAVAVKANYLHHHLRHHPIIRSHHSFISMHYKHPVIRLPALLHLHPCQNRHASSCVCVRVHVCLFRYSITCVCLCASLYLYNCDKVL